MTGFDTVLVANRGEIACRILRTALRLGLRTVAVFSDADRAAPHVRLADTAVAIGPAPARESYLVIDRLLEAAESSGAGAIHPGYGFLSENARFARAVTGAGLVFVGPTADQIDAFGAKHTARALAAAAGAPMIDGTGLLADVDQALTAAEAIGYPVMLKATGGGGGIGMQACRDAAELAEAFDRVRRSALASFGSGNVFLERFVESARHVEVQVFGDGAGRVRILGDRDCSLQRRNQKVIEEAPAPDLPDGVRDAIAEGARRLCASVSYRSAGTVEYIYDAARREASFLEVNARLQVEHPVTEQTHGIDLVEWMFRLARGEQAFVDSVMAEEGPTAVPSGHSVEARVYAEDPRRGHRPSTGVLTRVEFPPQVRVDGWVETGTEVGPSYDPMLAKIIVSAPTRPQAFARLARALAATRIDGIETNLGLLRAATVDERVLASRHTTATLDTIHDVEARIEVERGGTMTTVQDWPGRVGLWQVGVPPSGPMDDRSFRLGNVALGNPEGAAGLECTLDGPALRFTAATTVCVTGAAAPITVDGQAVPMWQPFTVAANAVLDVGATPGPGLRTYVLISGGLDVPAYLGSASTFTLGGFGGHAGRALLAGDVLHRDESPAAARQSAAADPLPPRPQLTDDWQIAVLPGPHTSPDFFSVEDVAQFYAATWEVHFNSARTGVRLVGPKPGWARPDGGDAGLHPSNIHDTPYSVGAVDFTGDVPILLGPDGPSLGGFVCPATVVTGQRWKLGQLRPGDTVRFVAVTEADAERARPLGRSSPTTTTTGPDDGVLGRREATPATPEVTYRRSGDDNLLIEYGPMTLDLGLRMRVHALAEHLSALAVPGVVDLTPGIRSLQVHVDPDVLSVARALDVVGSVEAELPATAELRVPSRTVHLPLSWDDPSTREAIERYMAGVRNDAPWCPWNIEFIRRVNGLDSVDDVHRIVHQATYLVLGLGDVYLGAPVATPLDPRHRLITTKYNPARTWTPENAVGIGGAYLCVYGMEGPGGYQFVGRTIQVWRRHPVAGEQPQLLRFFDQIRWYPVSAAELVDLRADMAAGRHEVATADGEFSLADHQQFLRDAAPEIETFRSRQGTAFAAERAAWAAAGEFDPRPETEPVAAAPEVFVPPGGALVEAPFRSSVWRVDVRSGDTVEAGEPLVFLEAMKLETVVTAPRAGTVVTVLVVPGSQVGPGVPLVVLSGSGDGSGDGSGGER